MNPAVLARRPWLGAVPALVLFVIIFAGIYWGIHVLSALATPYFHLDSPREKTAFSVLTSIVLLWTELAAMLLVLRLRGQTFADIGWRKRASIWGWSAAIVLTLGYAGLMLLGPLRSQPILSDWSFFRIATGLGVGITAGVCEEAIFRGFVMTQARDAGLPVIVQVALSALLFGLAHIGWGTMTGHINVGALLGSIGATAVLGALLGGVYVLGHRSLTPVMAAHGAIDIAIEPWLMLFALSGGFAHG
jgi:membrane protease YdiL (CAAX protease family)